jgi:hypothetical protein
MVNMLPISLVTALQIGAMPICSFADLKLARATASNHFLALSWPPSTADLTWLCVEVHNCANDEARLVLETLDGVSLTARLPSPSASLHRSNRLFDVCRRCARSPTVFFSCLSELSISLRISSSNCRRVLKTVATLALFDSDLSLRVIHVRHSDKYRYSLKYVWFTDTCLGGTTDALSMSSVALGRPSLMTHPVCWTPTRTGLSVPSSLVAPLPSGGAVPASVAVAVDGCGTIWWFEPLGIATVDVWFGF